MAEEKYQFTPTIVPVENDAEEDAKVLYKAMKGFGTDEDAIIEIIANRTAAQLRQIALKFKQAYGKDLESWLKKELGGNLEDAVMCRFYDPPQFDAFQCRAAMKGAGTDEGILIETILTKTNDEITAMKEAYEEMYKRDLEEDVAKEVSGDLEKMLVSALQAAREEDEGVDRRKAKKEALELKEAGEDAWGTDEATFNRILMLRSREQLLATFRFYLKYSGNDIEKAIKKEMGGDLEDACLMLIRWMRDPPTLYATLLRKAMKGAGTDDEAVIRLIMGRAEIDLGHIKARYAHMYHKTLYLAVKNETSGDYEKMLLSVIKEDDEVDAAGYEEREYEEEDDDEEDEEDDEGGIGDMIGEAIEDAVEEELDEMFGDDDE